MEFKVPEMGEGVHEGELVKWRVKVGDVIQDDQPLCDVMTDKATVEIPSPFSGKITALNAKEGQTVHVGQTICTYDAVGGASKTEKSPTPSISQPARAPAPMVASAATSSAGMVSSGSAGGTVLAAPSTRRLAREMGVPLHEISGSGPHGRILRSDLEHSGKSGAGATAGGRPFLPPQIARTSGTGGEERIAFKGLRKKIAEKMSLSKGKAAHFTYVEECDATELVKVRAQAKEIGAAQGIKVTYLPFLMKAMVAALRSYPMMNATLDEERGEIVYKHFYNISLSIQTPDGLTAPVIKNVEQKSILALAREIEDVVQRARANKLTREDFEGGTITLTNAGSIGGLFTTPIINFPEVAILAFNKIFKKPVVKTVNGQDRVVVRNWTYFSLSLDHRIVDGANAAEFTNLFIKYVENPSLLLLEGL